MRYYERAARLVGVVTGDRYGGETLDWTSPTRTEGDANVRPLASAETVSADRDEVVTRYRLQVPPIPPWDALGPADRVEWRGETYEIEGEIADVPYLGRLDHREAVLKRVSEV